MDSLSINGHADMPLVIVKLEGGVYGGFVPGFDMKYIKGNTMTECESALRAYVAKKVAQMVKDNSPFPFFPTEKEIYEDFENVEKVIIIPIDLKSRIKKIY